MRVGFHGLKGLTAGEDDPFDVCFVGELVSALSDRVSDQWFSRPVSFSFVMTQRLSLLFSHFHRTIPDRSIRKNPLHAASSRFPSSSSSPSRKKRKTSNHHRQNQSHQTEPNSTTKKKKQTSRRKKKETQKLTTSPYSTKTPERGYSGCP